MHFSISSVAGVKETQTGQVDAQWIMVIVFLITTFYALNYVEYWPVGNYNSLLHCPVQARSDLSLEKLYHMRIDLAPTKKREKKILNRRWSISCLKTKKLLKMWLISQQYILELHCYQARGMWFL